MKYATKPIHQNPGRTTPANHQQQLIDLTKFQLTPQIQPTHLKLIKNPRPPPLDALKGLSSPPPTLTPRLIQRRPRHRQQRFPPPQNSNPRHSLLTNPHHNSLLLRSISSPTLPKKRRFIRLLSFRGCVI